MPFFPPVLDGRAQVDQELGVKAALEGLAGQGLVCCLPGGFEELRVPGQPGSLFGLDYARGLSPVSAGPPSDAQRAQRFPHSGRQADTSVQDGLQPLVQLPAGRMAWRQIECPGFPLAADRSPQPGRYCRQCRLNVATGAPEALSRRCCFRLRVPRSPRRASMPSITICRTSGPGCPDSSCQCAAIRSSKLWPCGKCSALAVTPNHNRRRANQPTAGVEGRSAHPLPLGQPGRGVDPRIHFRSASPGRGWMCGSMVVFGGRYAHPPGSGFLAWVGSTQPSRSLRDDPPVLRLPHQRPDVLTVRIMPTATGWSSAAQIGHTPGPSGPSPGAMARSRKRTGAPHR